MQSRLTLAHSAGASAKISMPSLYLPLPSSTCVVILPWAAGMLAHCAEHGNCMLWHLLLFVSLTSVHCILSWRAGIETVVGSHLGRTLVPNKFSRGNKVYFVVTGKPEDTAVFLLDLWGRNVRLQRRAVTGHDVSMQRQRQVTVICLFEKANLMTQV